MFVAETDALTGKYILFLFYTALFACIRAIFYQLFKAFIHNFIFNASV